MFSKATDVMICATKSVSYKSVAFISAQTRYYVL